MTMHLRLSIACLAFATLLLPGAGRFADAAADASTGQYGLLEAQASKDRQDADKGEDQQEATEPVDFLDGPGRTLATFMQAMRASPRNYDKATACLDVPGRTADTAGNRARADQLYWVLYHLGYTGQDNPGVPATDRTNDTFVLLPPPTNASALTQQRAKQLLEFSSGRGRIALAKDEDGSWRFDQKTISDENIDALSNADRQLVRSDPSLGREFESSSLHGWLLVNIPMALQDTFLFIAYWQWLGLAITIFLGFLCDLIFRMVFRLFLRRWIARLLQHVGNEAPTPELKKSSRALGLLSAAVVWRLGIDLLYLPVGIFEMLVVAANIIIVLTAILSGFRMTDLLSSVFMQRAAKSENKIDDLIVPLIRKTLKFVILIIGFVYFAEIIDVQISPLLAGIGIGGLGFAFAAQNSIENFFGSVTVLLDRPFQVGDWVVIDDVEGTVVAVGMRSTRVRTFYDSLVTLPNSALVKTTVNNYGMRHYRRWSTKVGLLYETRPEQVEAYCEGIRELVRNHPYMRKESYQVYLNEFGDSAIQILVYVFWQAPDWSTELRERHRFMLDLMRLADALGVSFAYPTQTLYLARSPGVPETPEALKQGQEQPYNEECGRKAAREIIKGAAWLERKPAPYVYLDADGSKALDDGDEPPAAPQDPPTENRGSAGGE